MIFQELNKTAQGSELLENSEKKFNIVEYKTHNSNSRHHFDSPEYIKTLCNEPGTFKSVYLHNDSIKEYYREHLNLDGYEGKVYSSYLYMLTDSANYILALEDLKVLIEHLEDNFGIKRDWLYYQYDGENNFFVIIPARLFGDFSTSANLPVQQAMVSSRLAGNIRLSHKIYRSSALMPLTNTKIIKTGRYAVPLTPTDIFTFAGDLNSFAMERRPLPWIDESQIPELPFLVKMKDDVLSELRPLEEFFSTIFGQSFTGQINIRYGRKIKKSDYFHNIFSWTINEAISAAITYNGRENVYFGLAERNKDQFGVIKGRKDFCSKLSVIYADIDYGKDGHKVAAYFNTKEEVLHLVSQMKLQPTIVIHSGHGLQVLWKLNEPVDLTVLNNVDRMEDLMKRINEMFHGDPTQNVDRIFRVPYTINIKESVPVACTIEKISPELSYSLEELEGWVGAEYKPVPKAAPKTSKIYSAGSHNSAKLLSMDRWESVKSRCEWVSGIYHKAEFEHHLRHKERFNIASLLVKFENGENELHKILKQCSDYDEGQTSYQISQIRAAGYRPPLCNKLCPSKCYFIEDVAGRSPITLAYRRDDNE